MESGLEENFRISWVNQPATEKFLNQKQELEIINSTLYNNIIPIRNEKINTVTLVIPIDSGYAINNLINIANKMNKLTKAYDFTKRNDTINCDLIGFNNIKSSSPFTTQRFKLNKLPEKNNI